MQPDSYQDLLALFWARMGNSSKDRRGKAKSPGAHAAPGHSHLRSWSWDVSGYETTG